MSIELLLIAASLELLAACEEADDYLVTDEILEAAAEYRKLVDRYVTVIEE